MTSWSHGGDTVVWVYRTRSSASGLLTKGYGPTASHVKGRGWAGRWVCNDIAVHGISGGFLPQYIRIRR